MGYARMLGIAAALLLVPVAFGSAADPLLDVYGEVEALITDVEVEWPFYEKRYDRASFETTEQLVEGHTVFATIDLRADIVRPEEGNITITGFVDCRPDARFSGPVVFGVVIPTRVERVFAHCRVGDRVVVEPEPGPASGGAPASAGPPTPTGVILPLRTPDGQEAYAEELALREFVAGPGGVVVERVRYAWATPIFEPWTTEDGRSKNFLMPLPIDRLRENDAEHYRVVFENPPGSA